MGRKKAKEYDTVVARLAESQYRVFFAVQHHKQSTYKNENAKHHVSMFLPAARNLLSSNGSASTSPLSAFSLRMTALISSGFKNQALGRFSSLSGNLTIKPKARRPTVQVITPSKMKILHHYVSRV